MENDDTAIRHQLHEIAENVQGLRDDLQQLVTDIAVLVVQQRNHAEWSQKLEARVCAIEDQVPEKLRERLEAIEKLSPVMRAAAWLGGILVLSIVGLLWLVFTGQVELVFR